jgi:hypothetical protein
MIPAYSPQARGRMERNYRTYQGGYRRNYGLRGITTTPAGSVFLREQYIAEFNRRFAVQGRVVRTQPLTAAPNARCRVFRRASTSRHVRRQRLDETTGCLVFLPLGLTTLIWGQVVGASIYGTVKDDTGAGLPEAVVNIKNVETGQNEGSLVTRPAGMPRLRFR